MNSCLGCWISLTSTVEDLSVTGGQVKSLKTADGRLCQLVSGFGS